VHELTAHIDVFPTFCQLAGSAVPADLGKKLDGYSLLPLLESNTEKIWPTDRLLFQHVGRWPPGMATTHKDVMGGVRQGDYLFVRSQPCKDPNCSLDVRGDQCAALRAVQDRSLSEIYTETNAPFHWGSTPGAGGWSLYDIRTDPACQNDLSAQMPERTRTFKKAYDQRWNTLCPGMIRAGGDGEFPPKNP
jgi:arylsulfatase A-like enzyme